MKSINILGISAYYHDSSAGLVRNGEIIAAAQEERFTRKKGDSDFPIHSIDYCLQEGGLSVEQLDHVVFYDKPIIKFDRILASYIHSAPLGLGSFLKSIPVWLKTKLWVENIIRKELGIQNDIFFTEHHQAHASSAFFPSPFQEAAILTVDGAGEWSTTTIGAGRGHEIRLLKKIDFPHSLGLLYSAFTYYCGFRINSGEYKLMGLAPYGTPRFLDLIRKELVRTAEDGAYVLNQKYFNYISGLRMINRNFEELFGRKALSPDETPNQFAMDVAASIQEFFNQHMVKLATEARHITGLDNLCIAGGVGLNCVSNSRILAESGFKNVWIQPAAGDAGGSLGAALYVYHNYLGKERIITGEGDRQKGSYLGPSFKDEIVRSTLDKHGAKYRELTESDILPLVAKGIASQKVVGWFQGRMEFGPRALGNRSILGDARSEKMLSHLNLKIKFRESFRPFAPSVLEEKADGYFEFKKKSPYMLFVSQLRQERLLQPDKNGLTGVALLNLKRSTVPAITHLDNSARIQTVSKETNPLFHGLLVEFEKLTGCPLVINTSFNVRGEPIVCTPEDAYLCFMGTDMDILVIGCFMLVKEDQPRNPELSKWKKNLVKD